MLTWLPIKWVGVEGELLEGAVEVGAIDMDWVLLWKLEGFPALAPAAAPGWFPTPVVLLGLLIVDTFTVELYREISLQFFALFV